MILVIFILTPSNNKTIDNNQRKPTNTIGYQRKTCVLDRKGKAGKCVRKKKKKRIVQIRENKENKRSNIRRQSREKTNLQIKHMENR